MDETRLEVLENIVSCDCPNKSEIVPFKGPSPADLVVVGDNPGLIEVDKQMPFTGPAGLLLRSHLEDAGFDLAAIGWMNVISCYTPDTPSTEAISACKDNFTAQLKMFSPKWVLLLGAVALKAIMPKLEITHARGAPFTHDDWASTIFFPTFHPGYGLRKKSGDRQMARDIATLRAITLEGDVTPFISTVCGRCGIEADCWDSNMLGWSQCGSPGCGFPEDVSRQRASIFSESDGLSCRKTGCSVPAERHPVSFRSGEAPDQMSWSALSGKHQKLMQGVWTGGTHGVGEDPLRKAMKVSRVELLADLERLQALGWVLSPEAGREGWVLSPRGRMAMEEL